MTYDIRKYSKDMYKSPRYRYFPFVSKEEQDLEIIYWLAQGYNRYRPTCFMFDEFETKEKEENSMKHSDLIEASIQSSIKEWNEQPKDVIQDYEVMGLGELIERLAIANLKLFKEKDAQADKITSRTTFWYRQSVERDVELCRERAKLKNAIDKKIIAMISSGEKAHSQFSKEIKNYG